MSIQKPPTSMAEKSPTHGCSWVFRYGPLWGRDIVPVLPEGLVRTATRQLSGSALWG